MSENVTLHRADLLEVLRSAEKELRERGALCIPYSALEKLTETIACVEQSSNPDPDVKERVLRAVFAALDIKLAAELKDNVLHAGTALAVLMLIRDTVTALDPQLDELDFAQTHAAVASGCGQTNQKDTALRSALERLANEASLCVGASTGLEQAVADARLILAGQGDLLAGKQNYCEAYLDEQARKAAPALSGSRMLQVSFQYVGPKNISWTESFALDDSGCLADNVIEKAVAAKLDLGFLELEAEFINETDGLIYQNGFDVAIGQFFSSEVDANAGKVCPVESALQLLPEVTWDRWSGDVAENVSVFGWLPRDDGRADFVLVIIGMKGPWLISTSSAVHSAEFAKRLGFENHSDCKRVEEHFPRVRCVKLNSEEHAAQRAMLEFRDEPDGKLNMKVTFIPDVCANTPPTPAVSAALQAFWSVLELSKGGES